MVLAAGSWQAISAQQSDGKSPEAVSYAPKPTRLSLTPILKSLTPGFKM
jgi:hypothetical protein